ncbi:MAG: hypothetical protein NZ842_17185 [Dehalococcoidia bacterium]|nr:hypothetical protein [Dehalococcoidia bacterium]
MNPDQTLHSYTRVSSTSQEDEGTSLDTQKELGLGGIKRETSSNPRRTKMEWKSNKPPFCTD